MSVTIKDVAEKAGVSYSTVSKALRNSPLVKMDTKEKIISVAHELGYQPNAAARRLVSKKSFTIGVVWPSVQRVALSKLITEINKELEKRNYTMLISIHEIESAISTFQQFQVDAILVFNYDHNLLKEKIQSSTIPILNYGIDKDLPQRTIDVSRKKAIQIAVQHLVKLGHKQIAYIGSSQKDDPLQVEKMIGFKEEMQFFELPIHTRLIPSTFGLESKDGYLATKALLQEEEIPTAIISGSYDLTRGIMEALQESNLTIPKDISLISYDQIPEMEKIDPPITTVGVPQSEISLKVVDALISLINEQSIHTDLVLEPTIELRSSTKAFKK
ncbi:LacI family DNA-binding transcriptional regulator [Alkalihalobacillus trypoxylicola]|uniref:HTH lacI-type domain-containing protein n=1 Tax=Alkalihalobacillus trypoxylicola TaxID=519424 RepID=A0A162CXB7_9BACI|nr:LacI family DNA-binding transcriptional regulator [Alkalihalobacillus trypoxylicola]KYG27014.1 hypothetical protein AZF04_11810 [Alkalihalobacillus trypoxylicola]